MLKLADSWPRAASMPTTPAKKVVYERECETTMIRLTPSQEIDNGKIYNGCREDSDLFYSI